VFYLTVETYEAILRAAQEQGLPVIGHVPKQVGLDRVLAGGQRTIEHLTGYLDPDTADFIVPEGQLDRYAVKTREAGVWNCPTLGVYRMHVPDDELPRLESRPEMAYISPRMKILWKYMLRPGAMQNISYAGHYPSRIAGIYTQMTKALHDNGARIILGSDTDNPYLVPGASLLDELDYLVQAGFSPYEAIAAGTRNAAEALERLDELGTIAEGKRADLILVTANPLEDVRHVRHQEGVMVGGRWLPRTDLQAMLQALVDSYRPNFLAQVWPLFLLLSGIVLFVRGKRGLPGKGQ
jgi:imidazolonepropionase-like amidohydrolase